MEVQDELEALTGVVDNIIFASPEGSFCVFRLLPEGQKSTITVTVQHVLISKIIKYSL